MSDNLENKLSDLKSRLQTAEDAIETATRKKMSI